MESFGNLPLRGENQGDEVPAFVDSDPTPGDEKVSVSYQLLKLTFYRKTPYPNIRMILISL